MYAFSDRLKFVVFKIEKTAWKNLNDEEHKQPKNEESEAFQRVTLLRLQKFFKKFFHVIF